MFARKLNIFNNRSNNVSQFQCTHWYENYATNDNDVVSLGNGNIEESNWIGTEYSAEFIKT